MEKEWVLTQFKALLRQSNELSEMEFRLQLEQLIHNGGDTGLELLESLLAAKGLDTAIRLQMIRVCGYIHHPKLLIPLKKIIETEDNIHLKKEAVISVAKFNNQKALNILNHAITSLKNPLLMQTVNAEISKIKQNNPVLAVLPRFLQGDKNPKNFSVTINILKRILSPNDASAFVTYLNCGKEDLENGAFEVICTSGSADHAQFLCDTLIRKWPLFPCLEDEECEPLYTLLFHLQIFFHRFREKISSVTPYLPQIMAKSKDPRILHLAIVILGESPIEKDLRFMIEYFQKAPDLQSTIIESLQDNPLAIPFLFNLYEFNAPNRQVIIATLLNSQQGRDFFFDIFDDLTFPDQETVINKLPYERSKKTNSFINHVFQKSAYQLKEILLRQVQKNFDPSIAAILFDADLEKEFTYMGDIYLETIRYLFPIQTIRRTLNNLYCEEFSVAQIRRILKGLYPLQTLELFLSIEPPSLLGALMIKLLNMNNRDLSIQFLNFFRSIRTFDTSTAQNCLDALTRIYNQKDIKSSPQEKSEIHRCREWWKENLMDLKTIEAGNSKLLKTLNQKPFSPVQFSDVWKSCHISALLNIEEIFDLLRLNFRDTGEKAIAQWSQLFLAHPPLAIYLNDDIANLIKQQGDKSLGDLKRIHKALPTSPPKVIIRIKTPQHTATVMESLMYMMPLMTILTDDTDLGGHDILLCDTDSLKERMILNSLIPSQIYLFLNKPAEVIPFKDLNPKSFIAPFSYYRICREILSKLLL